MIRTSVVGFAFLLAAWSAQADERVVRAEEIERILLSRTLAVHAGASEPPRRYSYVKGGRYWSLQELPRLTSIVLGTYRVTDGRLCHRRDIDAAGECLEIRHAKGQGYIAFNDKNERLRIVIEATDWPVLRSRCENRDNVTWEEAIASCTMLIDFGLASWKDGVTLHRIRAALWPYGDERKLRDYDEAIRLDPRDAESYAIRGDALGLLGQRERSRSDYDQAIRLNAADVSFFARRAHLSMAQATSVGPFTTMIKRSGWSRPTPAFSSVAATRICITRSTIVRSATTLGPARA
jgi:tetratricopeptide (TPR) repeat protein